jgi:hypothetical protein
MLGDRQVGSSQLALTRLARAGPLLNLGGYTLAYPENSHGEIFLEG